MADVTNIPLPFSDVHLPIIFYIVLVVIGLLLMGGILLYLIYDWNLGNPLRIFFTTRIERWTNKKLAIFEVLSLSNNVKFEQCEGNRDSGYNRTSKNKTIRKVDSKKLVGGFILSVVLFIISIVITLYLDVPMMYSLVGLLSFAIPMYVYVKRPIEIVTTDGREPSFIIPKSIYSINTIDVIPLLDLHPNIPNKIKMGLDALVADKITTLKSLMEKAKTNPSEILYGNITYDAFLSIYVAFKNKYETKVKVTDVLNFISGNVDENARESIELKDYNELTHKKNNDKYIKYCYIGILLMCLAFFFRVVWRTVHGGG